MILRFYIKVKEFATTVINKRDQLIEEVNFLEGKIGFLKMGLDEMVKFYNLETDYFKVKLK